MRIKSEFTFYITANERAILRQASDLLDEISSRLYDEADEIEGHGGDDFADAFNVIDSFLESKDVKIESEN